MAASFGQQQQRSSGFDQGPNAAGSFEKRPTASFGQGRGFSEDRSRRNSGEGKDSGFDDRRQKQQQFESYEEDFEYDSSRGGGGGGPGWGKQVRSGEAGRFGFEGVESGGGGGGDGGGVDQFQSGEAARFGFSQFGGQGGGGYTDRFEADSSGYEQVSGQNQFDNDGGHSPWVGDPANQGEEGGNPAFTIGGAGGRGGQGLGPMFGQARGGQGW